MKYTLSLFAFLLSFFLITPLPAQKFEEHFTDSTLRLDYIFSGNRKEQHIALDNMSKIAHWYGKHTRLAELPLQGYGQITMKDKATGDTLYRNSFSTLFQEWLSYPDADNNVRSFENVFLVPMPCDTVNVTVELRNNRHEVMTSLTHSVSPTDILIRRKGQNPTPYITLQQAADTSHCIHLAFVAEGYTDAEMDSFIVHARAATEALFAHEPFKSMRQRFNVVAVESASEQSGPSEPASGIWHNTVLGSQFSTFYIDRYLTTLNLKTLHDVLAGTPYEHIIVLVNTDKYGGGGILNSYNLASCKHKWFKPVVVHEFGHSFAGLGDEYAYDVEEIPMYPHDVEPWESNITTLVNFEQKWKDMIIAGTPIPTPLSKDANIAHNRVGLFEGAAYNLKGIYRGVQDCRMRDNLTPEFCPVCRRVLQRVIDFYTLP